MPPARTTGGSVACTSRDLNNDGLTDVAATGGGNSPDGRIVIWFQDSSTHLLNTPIELQAYDIPGPVKIKDLNCDGRNEITVLHNGWNAITTYEQDLSSNYGSFLLWTVPALSNFFSDALSIGDINNDGKPDIVFAYALVMLLNNGNTLCVASLEDDNNLSNEVSVYPNPFNDELYVNLHFNVKEGDFKYTIYDNFGRLIKSINKPNPTEIIDLGGLAPGFYTLIVSDQVKIYCTKKLVKLN